MTAWLIKRKKEREQRQMEAVAAAAKEAAASLKPLTGALADLGKATKKFGDAAALDPKATTAQKIRITEEQLANLPAGTDEAIREYFMEAYRLGKVTTWGVKKIDVTSEREISWRGKREHSRQIIEDVRSILQLDGPTAQKRGYAFTISREEIVNRGRTTDDFKKNVGKLFLAWKSATDIPCDYTIETKPMQLTVTITTLKPEALINNYRFEGEIKELVTKAMLYEPDSL